MVTDKFLYMENSFDFDIRCYDDKNPSAVAYNQKTLNSRKVVVCMDKLVRQLKIDKFYKGYTEGNIDIDDKSNEPNFDEIVEGIIFYTFTEYVCNRTALPKFQTASGYRCNPLCRNNKYNADTIHGCSCEKTAKHVLRELPLTPNKPKIDDMLLRHIASKKKFNENRAKYKTQYIRR